MDKQSEGKIFFRPMELSDLPQIEIIEKNSFSTPWPIQAYFTQLTNNQSARYTVVIVNGKVAGYCGCSLTSNKAHIMTIAIHPNYRGQGLGRAILTHVMGMMRAAGVTEMTLEVRVSNFIAQSLYEKLGFKRCGIRPKYYFDNQEDAIIMRVTLNEQFASKSLHEAIYSCIGFRHFPSW